MQLFVFEGCPCCIRANLKETWFSLSSCTQRDVDGEAWIVGATIRVRETSVLYKQKFEGYNNDRCHIYGWCSFTRAKNQEIFSQNEIVVDSSETVLGNRTQQ